MTTLQLSYKNSMQTYYSTQQMTPELENSMNFSAKRIWLIPFRKCHQRIRQDSSEDEKIDAAQNCFYEVIEKNIPIDNMRSIYKPLAVGLVVEYLFFLWLVFKYDQ